MEVKFGNPEQVFFQSLKIGETYLDAERVLCIKIEEKAGKDDTVPVLAFLDGKWKIDYEHKLALVTKVKSTLIVES